jgi:hypothetical protein
MTMGSKPWPVLTWWIYPPNTGQCQAERIYIYTLCFEAREKETITRALPRAPVKKDFEFLLRFWRLGFPHDAIAAASPSFPSVVVHDSHRCVVDFVCWSSLVKAGDEEEEEEEEE